MTPSPCRDDKNRNIKTYFQDWQTCSSMALTRKGCDDAQYAVCAQQDQGHLQPEAVGEVAGSAGAVAAVVAAAVAPWWADRIRSNKHVVCEVIVKLEALE